MLKIKDNKIQLMCYTADNNISYKYDSYLKKYWLESSLKFVPYELMFSEEEMKTLIKIVLKKNPKLKITIEQVGE